MRGSEYMASSLAEAAMMRATAYWNEHQAHPHILVLMWECGCTAVVPREKENDEQWRKVLAKAKSKAAKHHEPLCTLVSLQQSADGVVLMLETKEGKQVHHAPVTELMGEKVVCFWSELARTTKAGRWLGFDENMLKPAQELVCACKKGATKTKHKFARK